MVVHEVWCGEGSFSPRGLPGRAFINDYGPPEKRHTGFWLGVKLFNVTSTVDTASAFTEACKLFSRQTINKYNKYSKQINTSLQVMTKAIKVCVWWRAGGKQTPR